MAASANVVVGGATATITADLGYIKDGVQQTPSIELFTPDSIEQLTTAPKAWAVNRSYEIVFTLVEPTLENIRIGWDITEVIVGAVAPFTLAIHGTLASVFTPVQRAVSVTGFVPGGVTARTVLWDRCVVSGPAPLQFIKSEETNLAVTFMALYEDTTNNRVGQFTDA